MAEQSFNSSIEQDIAQLEQKLAQKRAELELGQGAGGIQQIPSEKEILHEIVGEQISQAPASSPSTLTPTSTTAQDDTAILPPPQIELPSYLLPELREPIQNLVNVTFLQGLDVAIKQARASNNPALIDGFHDVIVDVLHKQLIERGKLQQIP